MTVRPAAGGASLAEQLGNLEVVVCCGSGGVGKTTLSAALGIAMVAELDRRVLVLTVDPARRLATALGIGKMGVEPVPVPAARLRKAGIQPRGELVAAMLDMKSAWDLMVERHAPNRESAERILANRFYQGISNAFVGSQDWMALETLYELHAGGEYDTVVIDTPPSRNALDFLEAPNRLSDFVGARLLSWLAGPSRLGWRAINVAAAPFARMADRLIGAEVLGELAVFVREIQGLYGGIQERATEVYRLLRSPQTGFVVVTTLDPEPFAEAEFFCARLRDYRMPLRAVAVNRVLPDALTDRSGIAAATTLCEDREVAGWLTTELGEPVRPETVRRLGEAHLVLSRLAERQERQLSRLGGLGRVPVVRLPLAEREVVDIEGLAQLTHFFRARNGGPG
ncbi:MAG TPA: ArsA-related P-loop ATPase [Candidatus Dormibacteraeota bacterium]|nr:ArsA-related P-loop ATPase [Candidatus Dormibacteraeota bacterium]